MAHVFTVQTEILTPTMPGLDTRVAQVTVVWQPALRTLGCLCGVDRAQAVCK